MWIKTSLILSCLVTVSLAVDEHRPKKREDRGKRQLEYSISHHYQGPHGFRSERRISGIPFTYLNPPNLSGPSRYTTINKDDLASENNHIHEHYGHPPPPPNYEHPPQHYKINLPKIIERPIFIKEPEPIIEIIIKESNITLPPPPTTPAPKKKKEEVQVFYVKYKKNPNGYGKDSVIYDKPVPAISPKIPDEEEHEEEHPGYPAAHETHETETLPPPPSTTLRTLIKPDSEIYHSESGIKVTFGKEGWDHSKRSNKPEELNQQERSSSADQPHSVQFPQARQLSNFPTYQKRAPSFAPTFDSNKGFRSDRPPQGYRPFNAPPPPSFKQPQPQFNRPPPQFSSSQFKYQNPPYVKPPTQGSFSTPPFLRQVAPQLSFPPNNAPFPPFSRSPSNPPQRQPVPYKPFEQPIPQQQKNFPSQNHNFNNPPPQFRQPPPSFRQPAQTQPQNIQFRPETHFPAQQHPPLPQQNNVFNPQQVQEHKIQQQILEETKNRRPVEQNHQIQQQQHQIQQQNHQVQQHHQIQQQQLQQNQQILQQHQLQLQQKQNEHSQNFEQAKNLVPPGGELIHSLPKYEQHYSIIEPNKPQQIPSFQETQQSNLNIQQQQDHSQQQSSFNSQQSNFNRQPQQSFTQQQDHFELQSREQQPQHQHQPQPQPQLQPQPQPQYEEDKQNSQNLQQTFYQQLLQQQYQPKHSFTTPRSTTVYRTTTSSPRFVYQTTTSPKPSTTTTEEPSTQSTTTKDPRILEAQLPDEVPEDLRAQLLSSGILNNADISILDYDKVGDIPLSALPPDQLANFYNAGGGSQIGAESQRVESVVKPYDDLDSAGSEFQTVKVKAPVSMKVVHYNPETGDGQKVQNKYLKQGAKRVDPVVLNDSTYNRYLPLKVNGTQFPIPDVPELKGKKISSVVVLAPVAYDFSSKRKTRKIENAEELALVQDDSLKVLLNNPTSENFRKFFENESKTRADKQSVILLVTRGAEGKEIFMYDVPSKSVSKLSGELSSAFVDAAEANAEKDEVEAEKAAASNIVETRIPYEGQIDRNDSFEESDLDGAGSEGIGSNIPIIDPMKDDLEPKPSEQLSSFVDFSGKSLSSEDMSVSSEQKPYNGLRL
ncbi:unnamed protein product [Brassicogethes aeneus]|uniref:Uncharacterized protein n=1 Tax=Brassicogethes aeneus TaxID=1431903 RepID=A0A9P0AZK1_BRAAE|nr:unnamed protein product [Brassicogethes aeneus]